ncbi:ROK family protein [Gemmatimonas sp.]|uniref:ROK family protein n=1 Tax=Gemmatimonas sp. TaxID=1962908 RepID=UPI003F7026D9
MRIGIDLGGTKIEAVALHADGRVLARQRIDTPREYAATVLAIVSLVQTIETTLGQHGTVGLGIPGTVVPDTGLVKNANSTWLIGRPLGHDLEAALERPVRIENDANCFALSEASDGAAAGAPVVFGVIMGTGVGGGIVINGQVLKGRNLIGGEWGHNPLPWPERDEFDGPACYCGQRGCIETWISGPGVAADHLRHTGERRATPEIMTAATTGDAAAEATRDRFMHRAARSLATIINVLDPDVIVLGGGVSNTPGLAVALEHAVAPWVFSESVSTRVVVNMHGDSSGVRGAAWLWPSPVRP